MQLLFALTVTIAMVTGLIFLVPKIWPLLPQWLALIVFILLAVAVIGYPIYSLKRWSDQRWQQYQKTDKARNALRRDNNAAYDNDDW